MNKIEYQTLEISSEENNTTNWKKFKTKNPKTAKLLKVGAVGTGVCLAVSSVLNPLVFPFILGASATTVIGSSVAVGTASVAVGYQAGQKTAKKFDDKKARQKKEKEFDYEAINSMESQTLKNENKSISPKI